MRTVRDEIQALAESWELKVSQAEQDDRISPGAKLEFRKAIYSWMAETIRVCARESRSWTRRHDDAERIPDMLRELADWLLPKNDSE